MTVTTLGVYTVCELREREPRKFGQKEDVRFNCTSLSFKSKLVNWDCSVVAVVTLKEINWFFCHSKSLHMEVQ